MGLNRSGWPAVCLATGCYFSYIPSLLMGRLGSDRMPGWAQRRRWTGAGLIGTIEGMALASLLPVSPLRYAAFLAVAIAAACWICDRAEAAFGVRDDQRIVLDEVVGYWTAIAFLPPRWPIWLGGLVLFRVFDAWKLPPFRWLERLPGGLGVVADDVGAGVAANICLRLVLKSAPCFGL